MFFSKCTFLYFFYFCRKNSMPNTNSSGILVPQKAPAVIQAVPTSSRHSEEIHLESLEHQPTTLVDLEQESSRNNESVEVIDLTSTLVADPNVNNPSFVADWSKLSSSSSVPNFSVSQRLWMNAILNLLFTRVQFLPTPLLRPPTLLIPLRNIDRRLLLRLRASQPSRGRGHQLHQGKRT